jgi:hypothetical protein
MLITKSNLVAIAIGRSLSLQISFPKEGFAPDRVCGSATGLAWIAYAVTYG